MKNKPAGLIAILGDAREFHGNFVIAEPGAYGYSFLLKDTEGIENPEAPRYEIEATADVVPDVTIDQPAADATVTAVAQLPVIATAKDDLGLRDMRLRFRLGDASTTPEATIPMASDLPRLQHHRVSLVWNLRELPLSDGMRIALHAEATDWFDLGPPHIGKSPVRTLIVVSAPQKEAEIVSRQADVLRILERAEQVEARSRANGRSGGAGGKDEPAQADRSRHFEAGAVRSARCQRAVGSSDRRGRQPGPRSPGRNTSESIARGEIQKRLERFERELADLRESHLGALDDTLTRAVKTSELQRSAPMPPRPASRRSP